jgi:hypothetical protein
LDFRDGREKSRKRDVVFALLIDGRIFANCDENKMKKNKEQSLLCCVKRLAKIWVLICFKLYFGMNLF